MKTVSLELAKQLEEEGIKLITEHYWVEGPPLGWLDDSDDTKSVFMIQMNKGTYGDNIPAPTTDELLEWLPKQFNGRWFALSTCSERGWDAQYRYFDERDPLVLFCAKTAEEALVKLVLWVKENHEDKN